MEHIVSVIDLGSNAARMSINKIHPDGSFDKVLSLREPVRLSEGMGVDRMLKQAPMERVCEAIEKFISICKTHRCESIAAVATAAVRNAGNRDVFLKMIKEKTGLSFAVISGEAEAEFSARAASDCHLRDMLIFDSGGGSTELVLVRGKKTVGKASLPLGAVVMTEQFKDRPHSALYRYVFSLLSTLPWLDEAEGLPLVGVGGSARCLASLIKREKLEDYEMHNMDIAYAKAAAMYQKIYSTAPERRVDMPGMDRHRADVILAGLTPMKVLMDMLSSPKVRICAYGVKEGVFFRLRDEILEKDKERARNEL